MSTENEMADPPMPLDDAEHELRRLAENVDIDGRWGWRHEQAASVVLAEVDRLRLELHNARMALLRQGRRVAQVPAGSHVHHIDGDPTNNDLTNLTIVESPDAP